MKVQRVSLSVLGEDTPPSEPQFSPTVQAPGGGARPPISAETCARARLRITDPDAAFQNHPSSDKLK